MPISEFYLWSKDIPTSVDIIWSYLASGLTLDLDYREALFYSWLPYFFSIETLAFKLFYFCISVPLGFSSKCISN
jgi:hypothetical protein